MNIFYVFFLLFFFLKIESSEFNSYVHKDLTEERVSCWLSYEVDPVNIRLWIDQVLESKIKEEERSKKPWAEAKINGILVSFVCSGINIEKLDIDAHSFRRKISKKHKKYISNKK